MSFASSFLTMKRELIITCLLLCLCTISAQCPINPSFARKFIEIGNISSSIKSMGITTHFVIKPYEIYRNPPNLWDHILTPIYPLPNVVKVRTFPSINLGDLLHIERQRIYVKPLPSSKGIENALPKIDTLKIEELPVKFRDNLKNTETSFIFIRLSKHDYYIAA